MALIKMFMAYGCLLVRVWKLTALGKQICPERRKKVKQKNWREPHHKTCWRWTLLSCSVSSSVSILLGKEHKNLETAGPTQLGKNMDSLVGWQNYLSIYFIVAGVQTEEGLLHICCIWREIAKAWQPKGGFHLTPPFFSVMLQRLRSWARIWQTWVQMAIWPWSSLHDLVQVAHSQPCLPQRNPVWIKWGGENQRPEFPGGRAIFSKWFKELALQLCSMVQNNSSCKTSSRNCSGTAVTKMTAKKKKLQLLFSRAAHPCSWKPVSVCF